MLGIWGAASRRKVRLHRRPPTTSTAESGPWVQVSRLGNPLFNEVIVPLGKKDDWNGDSAPTTRRLRQVRAAARAGQAAAGALPGRVPEPGRAYTASRADLVAILLTGMPGGVVPGFQNYTGSTQADMLRLNVAIAAGRRARTRSGCSAATSPASRTAGACSTTSSRSSCAPSPASPTRSSPAFTPDAAAGVITEGVTPGAGALPGDLPLPGHAPRRLRHAQRVTSRYPRAPLKEAP